MGVVDIERIADAAALRPQTRAVMFGVGLTVTSVPDGVLVGSPDAPGSVTGYERVDADGSALVTSAAVVSAIAGQTIAPATVYPTASVAVTTTDATPTDIGSPIAVPAGAPNSIAAISMTFIGFDVSAGGTIVLRRLYVVGRAGSADVTGSMPQVIGTDIISAGADTGATTNGRVIGGTFQPQATGVAARTIRWRSYVDHVDLYT